MSKKIILASILFLFLLIAIPMIQFFMLTQENGGRIAVNKRIEAPYLNENQKEYLLVFFGYVGCVKVCTPVLHQIGDFYASAQFAPLKPFVGVSFVNLMPELAPDQPDMFAKSFHPDFKGVYLMQKELMRVDRQFSLFFSKSISDPGEIDHSDHLYLIQRKKDGSLILKNIYSTHPIDRAMIMDDIRKLQKETK